MKNIIFSTITPIVLVVTAVSCNQASNKSNSEKVEDSSSETSVSTPLQKENIDTSAVANKIDTATKRAEKITTEVATKSYSIAPIIKDYLA